MAVEPQKFKHGLSRWATGITVVTTRYEDELQGFTASSFSSVSLEPPLIAMNIVRSMYPGQILVKSGVFAVNILKHEQLEWGQLFAGMMPEVKDRFADIDHTSAVTGSPILPDVLAWLDCKVYRTIDLGHNLMIIGEVQDIGVSQDDGEPLLYFNRQWGMFSPAS